jgi:hypothetical protein
MVRAEYVFVVRLELEAIPADADLIDAFRRLKIGEAIMAKGERALSPWTFGLWMVLRS